MESSVKKQQAIFYIETNRAFFYPGLGGNILQLPFPDDVISDLEVINRQKLVALIQAFFQSQKIPSSEILFVFAATIVFQKDFPIGQANKNEQQQFIEYVPFDEVLSKVMKRGNATRILAVNKQLYEMFKRACEDLQCTVVGVVAYPMLSEITPELLQTVDLPLILSKFDTFKQMSLVSATSTQIPSFAPEQMPEKSRRLPLLLGVFGLLMFILVAVIFISFSSNKPSAVVVKRLPPPVVTAAPVINQATESGETIPVSSGVQGVATGPASIFPKMGY